MVLTYLPIFDYLRVSHEREGDGDGNVLQYVEMIAMGKVTHILPQILTGQIDQYHKVHRIPVALPLPPPGLKFSRQHRPYHGPKQDRTIAHPIP